MVTISKTNHGGGNELRITGETLIKTNCLVAVVLGVLASVAAAAADPYSGRIGQLENQVAACINKYGSAACEKFRRKNLQEIETLYRMQQEQGYMPYRSPYQDAPQVGGGGGSSWGAPNNRRCRRDRYGREHVLPPNSTEAETYPC